MFSKTSKLNRSQDKAHTLALPAPSQASTTIPCLIPADIVVNGDITTVGEIQFDGNITGNLRAAQITIGQMATIRGDIVADEVIVRGHVIGNITGRRVHLSGASYVEGDIRHGSMGMEMGARIDGCCRHAADPLALAAPIAPAALPKPMSLARAASKSEERSPVFSATPIATATTPDASVSAEAVRPPTDDVEALKSTGLDMRARASKPVSGRKPATVKSSGTKPEGLDSALATASGLQSNASPEPEPQRVVGAVAS